MKLKLTIAFCFCLAINIVIGQRIQPDKEKIRGGELTIQPITHATLVLSYHNKTIYIDPTGDAASFSGLHSPDIILVTDIHGDHFDPKTIEAIINEKTTLVVPKAVAEKLPGTYNKKQLVILNNGEKTKQQEISIAAIPMYNLTSDRLRFHEKGRGNGYILNIGDKAIYISGDTEDIPEMRALQNIDIAFVCMNLPYTMDVKQAASAVLDFKPKVIYPYHYRGQDVNEFKKLVNASDKNIDVRLRNWYPTATAQ